MPKIFHSIRRSIFFAISKFLLLSTFSLAGASWAQTSPLMTRIYESSAEWTPSLTIEKQKALATSRQPNILMLKIDQQRLNDSTALIELPDGSTAQLNRSSFGRFPNYTGWSGVSTDGATSASFVIEAGRITGQIQTRSKWYRLDATSTNSVVSVQEVQRRPSSRDRNDVVTPPSPTPEDLKREGEVQRRAKPASEPAANAKAAASKTTIDVMMITTYLSRLAFGGEEQANTKIRSLIVDANTTFSELGAELRLVEIYPLWAGFVESSTTRATLDAIQAFKPVKDRRDTVGADIVIALIDVPAGGCGIAYLGPNSIYAYGVINVGDWCHYEHVLAHEIGHLFGADHNQEDATTTVPYAHGWPSAFNDIKYINSSGTVYMYCDTDLMGYGTAEQHLFCGGTNTGQFFSNPNRLVSLPYGYRSIPMGSSSQNNFLQVTNTLPTVQNFRTTPLSPGTEVVPKATRIRPIINYLLDQN